MARDIVETRTLRAKLRASTPLSIGGAGGDDRVDVTIARDGIGRPVLNGTALAGVLRSLHREALLADPSSIVDVDAVIDRVWGSIPARNGEYQADNAREASASLITVFDATITSRVGIDRRHGVGIDRLHGTAAKAVLYAREVVPAGATIDVEIEADLPRDATDSRYVTNALDIVADAFAAGDVWVGGGTSRGYGNLQLADSEGTVTVEQRDWSNREGVLASLRGDTKKCVRDAGPTHRKVLRFTVHWAPRGGIMVKDAQDGLGVDMIPLVATSVDTENRAVVRGTIPWSSLKGCLRSHAESLARSVLLGVDEPTPDDFLAQLAQLDVVEALFGSAKTVSLDSNDVDRGEVAPIVGRGALRGGDTLTSGSLSRDRWMELITAESKHVNEIQGPTELGKLLQCDDIKSFGVDVAFHVAIDRWTAQPLSGALYSAMAFYDAPWEPFRFELDVGRLSRHPDLASAAAHLLLVTVWDFANGEIPLGFGTHRGLGGIDTSPGKVTIEGCHVDGTEFAALEGERTLAEITAADIQPLMDGWNGHAEALRLSRGGNGDLEGDVA